MGKLLKGIVLDTHDITDHLMSKEDDTGRRVADGAIIDVNEESADGEEVEQVGVSANKAEGEKWQEVEGEKETEAADGADETLH